MEKPVRSLSTRVYVPPSLSVTAVVPPASVQPATTTIRSPSAGVAVTVLLPAVVFQVVPANVQAGIYVLV